MCVSFLIGTIRVGLKFVIFTKYLKMASENTWNSIYKVYALILLTSQRYSICGPIYYDIILSDITIRIPFSEKWVLSFLLNNYFDTFV